MLNLRSKAGVSRHLGGGVTDVDETAWKRKAAAGLHKADGK